MKFSISKKIYLIVAGIIVLTASISMLQSVSSIRKAGRLEIESLKQTIYKEKKEKIANLIETVYGLLNATDDPEKAKQIIGQLRYGMDQLKENVDKFKIS